MELIPLDGYAVIERDKAKDRTSGGLYLPDIAKEKRAVGIIKALPEYGYPELNIGDKVVFLPFSGKEITFNNTEYLIVPCSDIEAKLE